MDITTLNRQPPTGEIQIERINDPNGNRNDDEVSALPSRQVTMSTEENRRRAENNLNDNQKKRKIEEVFNSGEWEDPCEYESNKVREIVRKLIFPSTKFCRGEGRSYVKVKNGKKKFVSINLGDTNNRLDISAKKGYWISVLNECGYSEETKSLSTRTMYWKIYNEDVLNEIRQQRGKKNYDIRRTLKQGNYWL